MKNLLSVVRWLFYILGGLVLLAALAVVIVFYYPQVLGQRYISAQLVKSFIPKGYNLDWKSLSVQMKSLSFFEKNLLLHFQDLCFFKESKELDLCFAEGKLPLKIRFSAGGVERVHVGASALTGGRFFYNIGSSPETGKKEEALDLEKGLSYLNILEVESLQVRISQLKIQYLEKSQKKVLEGKASIDLELPWDGVELSLKAEDLRGGPLQGRQNQLELKIVSSQVDNRNGQRTPVTLSFSANAHLLEDKKIVFSVVSAPIRENIFPFSIKANTELEFAEQKAKGQTELTFSKEALKGILQVELASGGPSFKKSKSKLQTLNPDLQKLLSLKNCSLYYHYGDINQIVSKINQLELDCQLLMKLLPEKRNKKLKKVYLPLKMRQEKAKTASFLDEDQVILPLIRRKIIPASYAANFKLRLRSAPQEKWRGTFDIKFLPVENLWLKGDIHLQTSFNETLERIFQWQGVKGQVNGVLAIKEFQVLRTILDSFNILIPAPFHALKGPLKLTARGRFPNGKSLLTVPMLVQTDLSSPNQVFKTLFEGELLLLRNGKNIKPELRGSLLLSEVKLVLPKIFPKEHIQLFPDPRMQRKSLRKEEDEKKFDKKKQNKFSLDLKVATIHDGALKILSSLSDESIPISLDLQITENEFKGGQVKVLPFDVNLFKKNTEVAFLNLALRPILSSSALNGEILVKYADYTVIIKLAGTIEKPHIFFESRPPLAENDIMAVLLFGKTLDQLSGEEGDSVTSMQAAAADGAITLASLYLLSSTPVESIGYNSETKGLSAKIKLGQKTSLTLGGDMQEVNKIGLRRRLGANFVISTEMRKEAANDESSIWTLLEWYNRY